MSANLQNLIASLAAPAQDVEHGLWALLVERRIDNAIGVHLERLGAVVDQHRLDGQTDDEYRRAIRARIATNRSSGRIEQLLNIAALALNDSTATLVLAQEGTATIRLRIADVAVMDSAADITIGFLRQAVAGGVRLVFEYSSEDPADVFQLDDGPGLDVGVLATSVE